VETPARPTRTHIGTPGRPYLRDGDIGTSSGHAEHARGHAGTERGTAGTPAPELGHQRWAISDSPNCRCHCQFSNIASRRQPAIDNHCRDSRAVRYAEHVSAQVMEGRSLSQRQGVSHASGNR
jgi:hypothetical protein